MAYAIILGEDLSQRLSALSDRLQLGLDKLVIQAIEKLLEQEGKKSALVEIVNLQFKSPFRIP